MVKFITRYFSHLVHGIFALKRALPGSALREIDQALVVAENSMSAEIAFVVEEKFSILDLLRCLTARDRAVDLFSTMRIWDTKANNGVLLYLLLAERNIEIVVDRGVSAVLSPEEIESVCREIETTIKNKDVSSGVIAGISKLNLLLQPLFPRKDGDINEIPDTAVVS